MSLCECENGPRCELYNGWCGRRADWSIMTPLSWKPPLRLGPQFACGECKNRLELAWRTPIKGLTRPENADEDWRPSLMEVIRHARIAEKFEMRNRKGPTPELTDEQKQNYLSALRRVYRRTALQSGGEAVTRPQHSSEEK